MSFVAPANAVIIRADIQEILDLPTAVNNPSEGPRILRSNDRTVNSNIPELSRFDQVQNPSDLFGFLAVNISQFVPQQFELAHQEEWTDFQVVSIVISDIVFSDPNEYIAGVTLTGPSIIDDANSDPYSMSLTFTDNSITFLFVVDSFEPGNVFNFVEDGIATYLLDIKKKTPTPTPIPEPATLAMFGASMMGLALFRRRKQWH